MHCQNIFLPIRCLYILKKCIFFISVILLAANSCYAQRTEKINNPLYIIDLETTRDSLYNRFEVIKVIRLKNELLLLDSMLKAIVSPGIIVSYRQSEMRKLRFETIENQIDGYRSQIESIDKKDKKFYFLPLELSESALKLFVLYGYHQWTGAIFSRMYDADELPAIKAAELKGTLVIEKMSMMGMEIPAPSPYPKGDGNIKGTAILYLDKIQAILDQNPELVKKGFSVAGVEKREIEKGINTAQDQIEYRKRVIDILVKQAIGKKK